MLIAFTGAWLGLAPVVEGAVARLGPGRAAPEAPAPAPAAIREAGRERGTSPANPALDAGVSLPGTEATSATGRPREGLPAAAGSRSEGSARSAPPPLRCSVHRWRGDRLAAWMLLGGAFVLGINARPALVSRAASWVGAAGALLVIIPLLLRARA